MIVSGVAKVQKCLFCLELSTPELARELPIRPAFYSPLSAPYSERRRGRETRNVMQVTGPNWMPASDGERRRSCLQKSYVRRNALVDVGTAYLQQEEVEREFRRKADHYFR